MRKILLLLLLICSPVLAQETELRAIDANVLPETFINNEGTMIYSYPSDFFWVSTDDYRLQNYEGHGAEDMTETGMMELKIKYLNEYHIDPTIYNTMLYEGRQVPYTVEEVYINGRYAVIYWSERYLGEQIMNEVAVLLSQDTGYYTEVTTFGFDENLDLLMTYAIDVSASIRIIDPEVLEIDTSGLTASYQDESFSFNYPESYQIRYVDELLIVESRDFSSADLYEDSYSVNSPDVLDLAVATGLEGHQRISLRVRSRESIETALETEDGWDYDARFYYLLFEFEDGVRFYSEHNGGRLIWREGNVYEGQGSVWVYIDSILLAGELGDEHIVIIQAHSYGEGNRYALRTMMMNILATIQIP